MVPLTMVKIASSPMDDPAGVEGLVFMWVDEPSEIYAGRSVAEIMDFVDYCLGEGYMAEAERGHVSSESTKEFLCNLGNPYPVSLKDMLKKDILEKGYISIPNQIWSAYL